MARSNQKLTLTLYRELMREGRKVHLLYDFFTVHVFNVSPVKHFDMSVAFYVHTRIRRIGSEQAVDQVQRNGTGEANSSISCLMCSESACFTSICM